MQKTLTLFTLLFVFFNLSVPNIWADDICWSQTDQALYECRVKNVCEPYKSEKPVYTSEDYVNFEDVTPEFQNQQTNTPALDNVKKVYRENMGNIYKCGMIQSQKNSLTKLWEFIKQESSGQLSDAVGGQVEQRIRKLELSSNKVWCSLTDQDSIQNKLNILSETTYEMCKYTSYLEYIKSEYEKTKNNAKTVHQEEDTLFKVTPREVSNQINQTKNAIANEISHTYKVFPIAFHAYSEYENNFPIHFLLEVIRWDFLILRKLMYQNLMPVAQLGLKVINAMSH
jgi:hypothetical protein